MKNSAYKKSVIFELRQMVYFIPFFKIRSGTWGLKEHGQSYYQKFFLLIQNVTKYFEQCKEIQWIWTILEKSDFYFCVFFDCYCQVLISK